MFQNLFPRIGGVDFNVLYYHEFWENISMILTHSSKLTNFQISIILKKFVLEILTNDLIR